MRKDLITKCLHCRKEIIKKKAKHVAKKYCDKNCASMYFNNMRKNAKIIDEKRFYYPLGIHNIYYVVKVSYTEKINAYLIYKGK